MSKQIETVTKYIAQNLSIIPLGADKRPTIPWKTFQGKCMTEAQINRYFSQDVAGVGLVCGEVSGNLEAIDVDVKYSLDKKLFSDYKSRIPPELFNKLVIQSTLNGGYHLIYRCSVIEGNKKLAERQATAEEKESGEKIKVLIETRGSGGFIAIAPTKGYKFIQHHLHQIPEITPEEREVLMNTAREFNKNFKGEQVVFHSNPAEGELSPLEDYNEKGDVLGLLVKHSWKIISDNGDEALLRRPGKNEGHSAGYTRSKKWFTVFSTSTEFDQLKAYLPYAVYATLECSGDFKVAAKKLLEDGYGVRRQQPQNPPTKKTRIEKNVSGFLASEDSDMEYLKMAREDKIPMGLTTGIETLDKHYRFKRGNFTVVNGADNTGKAVCLETPIPTPYGWTTMGAVQVGDQVFGSDGHPCTVTFASPIMENKKIYEVVFSNKEKIRACEDHLWEVRSIKGKEKWLGGKKSVLSTRDMAEIGLKFKYKQKTLNNFCIDMALPLKTQPIDLPIKPYVLGAWLGDGDSRNAIIHSGKEDKDELALLLKKEGLKIIVKKGAPNKLGESHKLIFSHAGFIEKIRKMGLYRNKHIPAIYLRASFDQRLDLLAGLMDTDGHVSKRDYSLEFCTKTKGLAEGFMELLATFGIRYSVCMKIPSINGRKMDYQAYYIGFNCAKDTVPCFKLKRKLRRMRKEKTSRGKTVQIVAINEMKSVPVKCIQVDSPNSLFLIGKTMIPTHNTLAMLFLAAISTIKHNWSWIIYAGENRSGYIKRKLIELYYCKPITQINDEELVAGYAWVKKHYTLVANNEIYTYKNILTIGEQLFEEKEYQGFLVDPYNSLNIEMEPYSKLSIHDYHYLATSEFRLFCKKYDCSVYLNCHAITDALRRIYPKGHQYEGYPMPPSKADTEGGGKFGNRADDFITIHRMVQHPHDWMWTEFHIRKIKETETGGYPTPLDSPVRIKIVRGNCGFEDVNGFNVVLNTYTPTVIQQRLIAEPPVRSPDIFSEAQRDEDEPPF